VPGGLDQPQLPTREAGEQAVTGRAIPLAPASPPPLPSLRVDDIVGELDLKAGDVVADIGSGSGVFTVAFARAVGPTGTVYAVDIDQAMLDFVVDRARNEGLNNVVGVMGEYDDPMLPSDEVDFAFYHRTLHMIEHRQSHLNATANYMAPDGRIVIIESGRDAVRNWMWIERDHADQWMAAISFYPAKVVEGFDNRWFVIYQRPYGDSMLPGAGPRNQWEIGGLGRRHDRGRKEATASPAHCPGAGCRPGVGG